MRSLDDITNLCRTFAAARRALAQDVEAAQTEIDKVKAEHLEIISARTRDVAQVYDELFAAIEQSPGLFTKPRTQTLFGVKVGYAKGRGKISWKDRDQVVALIRKHLADQADLLIKTVEKPVKAALNGLPVSDLRRIGVTVVEAGDQVVIAPQDGDLDKMVAALLGDPATGDDDATPSEEAA